MSNTEQTPFDYEAQIWDEIPGHGDATPLVVQVLILAELRAMRADMRAVTMGGAVLTVEVA